MLALMPMGYQHTIAKEIREAKADYLLAVKNNQQELYQAIEDVFRFEKQNDRRFLTELDFGHGRIENRTCYISTDLQCIDNEKWTDVKTLIKVVSERYNKTKKIQEELSIRYYISSAEATA